MQYFVAPLNATCRSLLIMVNPSATQGEDGHKFTRSQTDRLVHFVAATVQIPVSLSIIINAICMVVYNFFLANVAAGFWCPVFFIVSSVLGILFTIFPQPNLRQLSLLSCLLNMTIFYMVVILIGMIGAAADDDVPKNKIRIVPHIMNIVLGLIGFMASFIQATTVGWKKKENRHSVETTQTLELVTLGDNSSQCRGPHTSLHVPEGHTAARPITPRSPVLGSSFRQVGSPIPPSAPHEDRASLSGRTEDFRQLYEDYYNGNNHSGRLRNVESLDILT